MLEIRGDLLSIECDAVAITTNGFVKNNGECVMGRGCAKEVSMLITGIPKILGDLITSGGNIVHLITNIDSKDIVSFPVKPESCVFSGSNVVGHMKRHYSYGDKVAGWACVADIDIITKSCHELLRLTNQKGWEKVLVPRAGCGAGELSWDDVSKVMHDILDDRFTAVTY